jgi:hypothetical protein
LLKVLSSMSVESNTLTLQNEHKLMSVLSQQINEIYHYISLKCTRFCLILLGMAISTISVLEFSVILRIEYTISLRIFLHFESVYTIDNISSMSVSLVRITKTVIDDTKVFYFDISFKCKKSRKVSWKSKKNCWFGSRGLI